jgi:3-oxoacyl-[acyl-carrier-protein] synthase III
MMPIPSIGVGVAAMGYAVPDTVRTNDWWPSTWHDKHEARLTTDIVGSVDEAAHERRSDVDPEIARHAGPYFQDRFRGTRERRVLADDARPSSLEVRACEAALHRANLDGSEVDLLLASSLVPDFAILGNQGLVAHKLGLRRDVTAMNVDAGCASFLHQIRVAARMIETDEARNALVYAGSAASRITDYTLPSSVVPADGAVAAVIRRVEGELGYIASRTRTLGDMHAGILCVPKGAPMTPWYATDRMSEPMTAQRVDERAAHLAGARAASLFRETADQLLGDSGYRRDDIAYLAVSQAGAWFGRAMADAIGLDPSRILPPSEQFERYGHMMQASVAMNLLLGAATGRLEKGDLVLAYSPGVGFTTAACLMRWATEPFQVGPR